MSIKIAPPFKFVPTISEEANLAPDEISLKQLRNIVAGRDKTFPQAQAIALLLGSDFPNKHRDFEVVLENEKESPHIRYQAALSLGIINSPVALEILIKNSQIRDERVLAGVMTALGRIGDKKALDAVLRAKAHATGLAASQAKFSAALISHRLGLKGNVLPVPKDRDYLTVPDSAAHPFQITQVDDTNAEFCLRSIADQTFGIEFSEQPMYQIRCGRNVWMILFNRDFVGQDIIGKLGERKAFPGVIATKIEETGLYSTAFLILTSPTRQPNTVNILIYRTNGDLVFGGTARVERNRVKFSIRSVSRPGAFAVLLEGAFENGRLETKTALSTVSAQVKKRQPVKGLRPEGMKQQDGKP